MSLEALRNQTLDCLRRYLDEKDSKTLIDQATKWFDCYKRWEEEETWERAFKDDRITVRIASEEAKRFDVQGLPVYLNATVHGAQRSQDPAVFLEKRKNEEGLHDVAAVLLRGGFLHKSEKMAPPISKQMFTKNGDFVFMPIPLEEDLQLFYELSAAAKQGQDKDLKDFVVNTRAKMTRLKFGDPNDMMAGFGVVVKDGEPKVRYGVANIRGNAIPPQALQQRTQNALHYKSKIIPIRSAEGNNEVTMKVRHHAGSFPWLGLPHGSTKLPPQFKKIPKDTFLIKSIKDDTVLGLLKDSGQFHPVPK